MKRVYLVRHGKAVDEGYREDEDRPLTDEGRERMRRTARALAHAARPAPEVLLTSPLVRAVMTCEICAEALAIDGPVEVSRALTPTASVGAAAALVQERPEDSIMLFGHEPLFSGLAAHLLGLPSLGVPFKKGAVIAIDLPGGAGAGRLVFSLRPAGREREPELRHELS